MVVLHVGGAADLAVLQMWRCCRFGGAARFGGARVPYKPDLFIANLLRRARSTVEGFGYAFPDPRGSVQISIQARIGGMLDHCEDKLGLLHQKGR